MYPHERALVKRLADQPFALVGVNSDKIDRVKEALERENITWPSFWDGGSTGGPIARAWGVRGWPTIYVIDDQGVIRHKNVRGEAMEKAVDALLERAIVTLVKNIKSEDPSVRGLAAFRMGKYNAPDAVETVSKLLQDDDAVVQQRAATGLALLGQPVSPLLALMREATSDENTEVRIASLESLGLAKDKESTVLAIAALDDKQAIVRLAAVKTLGLLGDPAGVPALAKAVEDDDATTARTAAFALADMKLPESIALLHELAKKKDHLSRVWIAVALKRAGEAGNDERFKALMADKEVSVRRQIATALTEMEGFDATDLMIAALEDQDTQVCATARQSLSKNESPKAQEAIRAFVMRRGDELLTSVSQPYSPAQRQAQMELRSLGSEFPMVLFPKLDTQLSPAAGSMLAASIGLSRDEALIDPVLEKLKDANLATNARRQYETILRYLMTKARPKIDELVADQNATIRETGIRMLVNARDADAKELLKKALKDSDLGVRTTAAAALGRSRVPEALPILKEAIQDGNAEQRSMAITALAYQDPQEALPLLTGLVSGEDQSARMMALVALGRIRTEESTEAIAKAARKHSQLRLQAITVLYQHRTPAAAKVIGEFLDDDNETVQRSAKSWLQRMRIPEAKEVLEEHEKKTAEKTKEKKKS